MGMFVLGWLGYRDMRNVPDDALLVKVTAQMWQWKFEYPNGLTTDTLYAAINTPMRLNLTSLDVNHSLYIPAFRIKKDVIPNRKNVMWFKAIQLGSYDIACAEFCGLHHAYMYTKVVIKDSSSFDNWYKELSLNQGKPYNSLLISVPK
jgi:cytochrome c oxidase subunit II